MKVIDTTIALKKQGAALQQIGTIKGNTVKVDIEADSYSFQSHARIHVFSPAALQWNLLHSIPYGAMKTKSGLHINPSNVTAQAFAADRDQLIAVATKILPTQSEE